MSRKYSVFGGALAGTPPRWAPRWNKIHFCSAAGGSPGRSPHWLPRSPARMHTKRLVDSWVHPHRSKKYSVPGEGAPQQNIYFTPWGAVWAVVPTGCLGTPAWTHTQRFVDSWAAEAARPAGKQGSPAWVHPHGSKKYSAPGRAPAGTPPSWAPPRSKIVFRPLGSCLSCSPRWHLGAPARMHN